MVTEDTAPRSRPTGMLRMLMRFPVLMYRARLGWLLGGRFLLLTHRGRKSGRVRRTALEVVAHDGEEYFVVAGYGPRSDWYLNSLASPPLRVDVGFKAFRPQVRELDQEQRVNLLADYAQRHPRAARMLGRAIFGKEFSTRPEALRELAAALPALAFRPLES